jgi:endonuclease/exonuclease/phosphatase family metal-dependent hydrolase
MLKLMSYNIRFGGVGREKPLAEVVRRWDPDLVALQEATRPDVVERLSKSTGLKYWAAKSGLSTAFLSKIEIEHYEWHSYPRLRRPILEIRPAGGDVRIYNIHLRATHSNLTERGRMREIRAVLGGLSNRKDEFHFLTGDFNTLAPGELLNMEKLPWRYRILALALGGRVTYRTIQIMLDNGYIDSYRQLHADPGFTFPTWDPHVRLDYVFTRKAFAEHILSCEVVKDAPEIKNASDHLPLLAEINID